MQGNMSIFEDRSDLDCKLLSAYITLVRSDSSALALHLAYAFGGMTMRANRTLGPKLGFNKLVSGLFIMETRIGKNTFHGFISLLEANISIFVGPSSIISRFVKGDFTARFVSLTEPKSAFGFIKLALTGIIPLPRGAPGLKTVSYKPLFASGDSPAGAVAAGRAVAACQEVYKI